LSGKSPPKGGGGPQKGPHPNRTLPQPGLRGVGFLFSKAFFFQGGGGPPPQTFCLGGARILFGAGRENFPNSWVEWGGGAILCLGFFCFGFFFPPCFLCCGAHNGLNKKKKVFLAGTLLAQGFGWGKTHSPNPGKKPGGALGPCVFAFGGAPKAPFRLFRGLGGPWGAAWGQPGRGLATKRGGLGDKGTKKKKKKKRKTKWGNKRGREGKGGGRFGLFCWWGLKIGGGRHGCFRAGFVVGGPQPQVGQAVWGGAQAHFPHG